MKRLARMITVLATVTIVCISCGVNKKKREHQKAEADKLAEKELINALAKRHGALVEWQNLLPSRGNNPFTYDLKKALISSNARPVLLVMSLKDVKEREGGFEAQFSNSYFKKGMFELVLDLNCTTNQGAELLAKNDDGSFFNYYAIVANVTQVNRPIFSLGGTFSGEYPTVEVDLDNNVFCAKATCTELIKLKELYFIGDE